MIFKCPRCAICRTDAGRCPRCQFTMVGAAIPTFDTVHEAPTRPDRMGSAKTRLVSAMIPVPYAIAEATTEAAHQDPVEIMEADFLVLKDDHLRLMEENVRLATEVDRLRKDLHRLRQGLWALTEEVPDGA